jgi:DNA-binding transcriptional regulator LsrR (DeoR family)
MTTKRGSEARHAEQIAAAMSHRRDGLAFSEIAARLGVSKTTAHRLTQEALAEYRVRTETDTAEHVSLQLARIDSALQAISTQIQQGHLGAIDRLIRLEERRARLLGLDAPTRLAPTTPDGKYEFGGGVGLAALLSEAKKQKGD